jgi:hypothetical protein
MGVGTIWITPNSEMKMGKNRGNTELEKQKNNKNLRLTIGAKKFK